MYTLIWNEMVKTKQIERIDPPAGIPGGEVVIEVSGATSKGGHALQAWFGGEPAHIVAATGRRALALVPELNNGGEIEVSVDANGKSTKPARFITGRKLAGDLHPVANPAFDPTDGSLFVTKSGARGEHVPVSLYRISSDGDIEEFSGDIINPTGIAFDRIGRMFVTSRLEGTIYRVTPLKEVVMFAGELGIATGLAFKASVAPFHQWTPDVYQGAPTPVTSFMAVATKAAAFAIILRFFDVALHPAKGDWDVALAALAVASIAIGNIGAIGQDSLNSLLM